MNAQGQTKQFGDAWSASITHGECDGMSYHEVPFDFKTEKEAKVAAEYVAWVVWTVMVDWS